MSSTLPYTPMKMTPELARALKDDGYILPDTWPFPARVVCGMPSAEGWKLQQIGSMDRDHPHYMMHDADPRIIAPDGTPFVRARGNTRAVFVSLSRRVGAQAFRVLPGVRRPKWVIEDAPKGEIPDHLKRYLLKPGQKLSKGEKHEAEALAIEPAELTSHTATGRTGTAVAVLGPRPKPGTPERTEWNRKYRALRKDHFDAYRASRKTGRTSTRAAARA